MPLQIQYNFGGACMDENLSEYIQNKETKNRSDSRAVGSKWDYIRWNVVPRAGIYFW